MMMERKSSLPTDTNSSKKGYHYNNVMHVADKEVPNLEPITSYDSSSTTALSEGTPSPSRSMTTTVTIPELLEDETSMALRQVQFEEQLLAMAEDDMSLLSPDNTESQMQQYFSKQEFQTLLTPTFIECLEATTEEYNSKKQMQRLRRKELIQRELEAIIQITTASMANDENEEEEGQEFEPEAVEALGIAANRVAYLKKYYDVTSCQYIYVPSVAYTILNGSLLEEASQHYFGKSEEFLIAYAASLGTTVLQNGLPQVLPGQVLDSEDEEEEDEDDHASKEDFMLQDSELGLEATAIKYWGISPLSTAQSVVSPRNTFTFDSSVTTNHSPVETSTTRMMMMMNSVRPNEHDGTWNDFVAATASNARLDGSSVNPMDSSTLDYSVTSQDSPADSMILGEVHDFSLDAATVETKDVTTTVISNDCSLTGMSDSITPMKQAMKQATTVDSPGQTHITKRMDSMMEDQDGTVSPTESPVAASENAHSLILDSSVTQEASSSVDDFTMLQESPGVSSNKPNPLTLDPFVAITSHLSIMAHDSTPIDSVTLPKESTTGSSPCPDKTPDMTLDSSVSSKTTTKVDPPVQPEESTIHYSTSPKNLMLQSTEQSLLLLERSDENKDVTVDSSVVPGASTLQATFHESVKPYDSDSTCDVAAHDMKLDSSATGFSMTLDSGVPNDWTSQSCVTPTRPKMDSIAKDGTTLQGLISPKEPTLDDTAPTLAVSKLLHNPSMAAKDVPPSGNDSISNPVKKSSPRLIILLAIVISLGIGATLLFPVNTISSTVKHEEYLLLHEQPSSTRKATSALPVPNGHSSQTVVTTWPREETRQKKSITKGQMESGETVATNNDVVASSSLPPNNKKPTRTRPIVPNLWY